jgi:hypothetical protein
VRSAAACAVGPFALATPVLRVAALGCFGTTMKNWILAAALLPAATWVSASPLEANAEVPALGYSSAFADYKPYDEAPRADWREVNRVVDEAARKSGGGHAGHGAAPAPTPPASAAPTTPASPRPAPSPTGGHGGAHHGHGAHGGGK